MDPWSRHVPVIVRRKEGYIYAGVQFEAATSRRTESNGNSSVLLYGRCSPHPLVIEAVV